MKSRVLLSGGCVILMAAGLVALGARIGPWQRGLLAKRWQERLPAVADENVEAWLLQIGALGNEGVAVLVAELGSRRRAVSRGAATALHELLNNWERLPAIEAGQRMERLSQELADHHAGLEETSQRVSADLALRMLTWPTPGALVGRSQTISACQMVLDRPAGVKTVVEGKGARGATSARLKAPASALSAIAPPRADSHREPLHGADAIESDASEHVGFEENAEDETGEDQAIDEAVVLDDEMDPNESPGESADEVAEAVAESKVVGAHAEESLAESSAAETGSATDVQFPVKATAALSTSRAESPDGLSEQPLSELDLIQVFARLHADDPDLALQAREELAARGCTERLMELGKRLTSPDAEERCRWAEALPGMRGVEAKAWLLHLSHDTDAGVRQTTVGLMATSSDPEMLDRVRQLARDDTDPHVRQQASRLAASQRRATRR